MGTDERAAMFKIAVMKMYHERNTDTQLQCCNSHTDKVLRRVKIHGCVVAANRPHRSCDVVGRLRVDIVVLVGIRVDVSLPRG